MTVVPPPPNPSLVAIIVVVRTRAGPRFVYHYPPSPLSKPASGYHPHDRQRSYDESSSSDGESTATSDDDAWFDGHGSGRMNPRRANATDEEDDELPGQGTDGKKNEEWRAPWNNILGLDASALQKLLIPSDRSWHKRRFEVGLNELVFVGWPIFINEDGSWRKKRRKEGAVRDYPISETNQGVEVLPKVDRESQNEPDQLGEPIPLPPALHDTESGQEEESREMTVFNVVFVLNPPTLEYSLRVKEMYDHVVKKLGQALRWEQARANYIWKQSKIILKAKDQACEKRSSVAALYTTLQRTSSLANAIAIVYDSISRSLIASASLTPTVSISLQIPPATSTSVLPSSTDPPSARTQPGVWLTTATVESSEDIAPVDPNQSAIHQAKHLTLLLLDDGPKILADVAQSGGPLATALAHYIRVSSPAKSFAKISAENSISLADIQLLASHLIYWRRARAIPPLHQRDTYIVSPNADLRKLSAAVKAYESTFRTMPSLPKMLQALSGGPRPFSSLIPSKEHKNTYFAILAWLLRGGWVTQLRSFAFVRVDSSLKTAVKEQTRTDKNKSTPSEKSGSLETSHDTIGPLNLPKRPSMTSRASSDVRSSTSSYTNIRLNSLILQPARASTTESKWLDHIKDHLHELLSADVDEEDISELQQYWPKVTKYLNGIEPLEKIPVREGLKRKFVWDLFARLGLLEPLANEVRPERESQRRIIIGFRHW